MFQRSCLMKTRGFKLQSVTEDFLTSMHLHALGCVSKFIDEPLAVGLSPGTLAGFMKQRARWFCGTCLAGKYAKK